MDFQNSTALDDYRLYEVFLRHTVPYNHERLTVRVRYSRAAAFSGSCYYRTARLNINLGRRNEYPFRFATQVARAQSNRTHWWRELYYLTVADGYQLALFIYLHELYHHLVKAAGRCPRRKESMCDRFATRVLVDHYGCALHDRLNRPVPRQDWYIRDLDRFVSGAPRSRQLQLPLCRTGCGA